MLNSPSVANTTVNSSVQFLCEYACISNAVAVWFIEEKIDMNVNSDQLLVRKSSNRDEACKNATPTDTLYFSEILEIHPLYIPYPCTVRIYCHATIV